LCDSLFAVGEPIQLTTGSTRVSQVRNQSVLKFVKKFQLNSDPNLW